MKRTNPAVDLAGTASSARPCALRGAVAPGAPSATRLLDDNEKRNGFVSTRMGVTARRQRSFTT